MALNRLDLGLLYRKGSVLDLLTLWGICLNFLKWFILAISFSIVVECQEIMEKLCKTK